MSIRSILKETKVVVAVYDYIRQSALKMQIVLSPRKFIERKWRKKFGYDIDLDNPQTFNEKLNWMKLYWQDPIITSCIDKYLVRTFVEDAIGAGYLVKLYGVYNSIDEVNFTTLPEHFALKMNNGSGCNLLCRNKSNIDIDSIKRDFRREFKRNYYYTYCEWGYKNIVPRVICEELIETEDGKPPKDYKIFCFNGEPEYIFVASDRINHQTKFDFYDVSWNWLPVKNHYPNAGDVLPKPAALDEMLEVARKLSKPFPQVRVDLYYENGRIYFGELTFYHFSGFTPFEPDSFDFELGKKFELPEKKNS